MEISNLNVLLLGWDETASSDNTTHPSTLALARALAPHTQLALLLPHLPAALADLPTPAHVTGIGNLTVEELAEAQAYLPSEQLTPTAYPAFPYVGATHSADDMARSSAPTATTIPAETNDVDAETATAAPTLLNADAFAAEGSEPSAAEANDLSDFLETPETLPAVPVALPIRTAPAEALAVLSANALEGGDLNFRVIQYARFAARLALQEQFAVIYAADWPTWLAGMEIRQLTGRPLVLHVHSLAADRDTPHDRGWILELERLALRRADLVLAATAQLQNHLITTYNLPAERVRLQADSVADGVRQVLGEVAAR